MSSQYLTQLSVTGDFCLGQVTVPAHVNDPSLPPIRVGWEAIQLAGPLIGAAFAADCLAANHIETFYKGKKRAD